MDGSIFIQKCGVVCPTHGTAVRFPEKISIFGLAMQQATHTVEPTYTSELLCGTKAVFCRRLL